MTTVIDLTRQSSFQSNSVQRLIDNYITNRLQRTFSNEETAIPFPSIDIYSPRVNDRHKVSSDVPVANNAEVLQELRDNLRHLLPTKMKLLIEENQNFLSIIIQQLNYYHFQQIVKKLPNLSSATSATTLVEELEEFNVNLECFIYIFQGLEDFLFLLLEETPKELFQNFFAILNQLLMEYQKISSSSSSSSSSSQTIPKKRVQNQFLKTSVHLFNLLTSLLLMLQKKTQEETDATKEIEEERGARLTSKLVLDRVKEQFFERLPAILATISIEAEIYERLVASNLQKYLFQLINQISAELEHFTLFILSSSSNLPSIIQLQEKAQQLPSFQEYHKLLTVICSVPEISLYPVLIQTILKCHAALCSLTIMMFPSNSNSNPLISNSNPSKQVQEPAGRFPPKGTLAFSNGMVGVSPQKAIVENKVLQQRTLYDLTGKPDDLKEFSIKKRGFNEISTSVSTATAKEKRARDIIELFKQLSPKILEVIDLSHDMISQFLFTLYQKLYPPTSTQTYTQWNYNYSSKSCSLLITLLIPLLFTHHSTLSLTTRLLISVIFRFQLKGEGEELPTHPQFSSLAMLSKGANEVPTATSLFTLKRSLVYGSSYATGIHMILRDERAISIQQAFLQLMSDSSADGSTHTQTLIKPILYNSLPSILDTLLRLFLSFQSLPEQDPLHPKKQEYIDLLNDLLDCLCDQYEPALVEGRNKALAHWIHSLNIVNPSLERILTHCIQRELRAARRFLLLFSDSSKFVEIVEKKKDAGITDVFSTLEEEEEKRSSKQQNKRQKIVDMLDDGQKQWKQKEEEEDAESLWKWLDPNRVKPSSKPVQTNSSLIHKSGVESDWKKQLETLRKEQELARAKAKAVAADASTAQANSSSAKVDAITAPSLSRAPSFISMDEETDDKKLKSGQQGEQEEELKKPVVLFNIHEYMKDHNNKPNEKVPLTEEQKALEDTKRMLAIMAQRDQFFQNPNYYDGVDLAKISDSIMSVSIDPICKDILNLSLPSLLATDFENEAKEIEDGEILPKTSKKENDNLATATNKILQSLPIRFTTAEQYINAFQPLLVEEFIAALTAVLLNEEQGNHGGGNNSYRYAGDANKEFHEIYVQSEVIVLKQTDKDLMEVQLRLDNGNNHRNRSNNLDLQKDELVLILKGHSLPAKITRRKELVKLRYTIGIINHTSKRKKDILISAPENSSSSISGQYHTVLVKRTSDLHPKQPMMIIPIMNLSTFLREWTALHSIHNATLVPLAPYLMSGSPVCSPTIINNLSDRITQKIQSMESMKKFQYSEEDIAKIQSSLIQEIEELNQLNVDPSVLKATGIAKLLVNVVKHGKKQSTSTTTTTAALNPANTSTNAIPSYVPLAEKLIERWRQLVREQSDAETIKNLKGGKVIKIPTKQEITIPSGLSFKLWTTLAERYNESQLYAIKYVVNQFDSQQDTRIGLIQGPPGSGKTSTIIGIVSALLNHSGFTTGFSSSSSAAGPMNGNHHLSSSSASHQQRILICAPSNAAIDEILTRLALSGIYNQDGKLVNQGLKIVRLGEAINSSSSPLIHSLTLDAQIEQKMLKEDLYLKYNTLQEDLETIQQQFFTKQTQITDYKRNQSSNQSLLTSLEQQLTNLRLQLLEYRNTKLLYEISLDRMRSNYRQQLLFDANIVGTTLSSAGKQQFLDYIMKENVFFLTCIIDEAGQTTEPSTLIPLRFGCRRLVLVGDPRQLPATVLSRKAEKYGLGRSLFERLEKAEHEVVMLTMQYRMHPEIRSFPSKYFYQNLLIDCPEIQEEMELFQHHSSLLPIDYHYQQYRVISPLLIQNQIPPLLFVNVHQQAKEIKQGKSFINEKEIYYILQFLVFLIEKKILLPPSTSTTTSSSSSSSAAAVNTTPMTVAIISPYKAQVRLIQQRCSQHPLLKEFFPSITNTEESGGGRGDGNEGESAAQQQHHQIPIIEINTVDGFQGREKDIVLISTVRSNVALPGPPPSSSSADRPKQYQQHSYGRNQAATAIGRIGFVSDERRLNVAITRARKCLFIFGNKETLMVDIVWREMIQSLQERKYIQIPEEMHCFHS